MVSLDTTGCLEGGEWHRIDSSAVGDEDVGAFMIAIDYPFRDPLLLTLSNYHIAPTEVAALIYVCSTNLLL
ncbi:hypothetical protein TNCV_490181 [Trichonephila clavipes]|nr:hypothetical protein TNCV_490181 [Trichonephila clavipes]